jgi:hypothetical protein
MMCGLQSANGDHACVWCTAHKKDIADFESTWAPRMWKTDCPSESPPDDWWSEQCDEFWRQQVKAGLGQKSAPFLDFIPLQNIFLDELHLMLRIVDKLVACLFDAMKTDARPMARLRVADAFENAGPPQCLISSCRLVAFPDPSFLPVLFTCC